MFTTIKRSERGQAILLIAVAFIGLLGFTALVVDGGMIYAERRHAQNSADVASISGAVMMGEYDLSPDSSAAKIVTAITASTQAAFNRALANGYDDDGVSNTVTVSVEGPYFNFGYYWLVSVTIDTEIDTAFAHLIFSGKLAATVNAVARVRPSQPVVWGQSLIATCEHCCNALKFSGTNATIITGGGVFSNSDANNSPSCTSMELKGTGNVKVTDGSIGAVGSFRKAGGSGEIYPWPDEGIDDITIPPMPIPNCQGLADRGSEIINSAGEYTLYPGVYRHIVVTNSSAEVKLKPGMYCITGNKGFTSSGGILLGDGVLIFMQNGNFDVGGDALVKLFAPTSLLDASGNQWAGMLIYMDPENNGIIHVSGSTDSAYVGTIYAPTPTKPASGTKCFLGGTGEVIDIRSQVICYTIDITGSATLSMFYSAEENFRLPAFLDSLR